MTPAAVSLLALLAAIALSCTSRINVGLLAVALAWLVGIYAGRVELVTAGFPAQLFLTLAGVTLLFTLAEVNGTLHRVAMGALGLARGRVALLPWMFFLIACGLSTVGPGAVASVALVVPMAMAVGARAGMSPFLTALMVANGANAGNLSPFSSVGIIANTKMREIGLGGTEWKVWAANFVVHLLVAVVAYVALGGMKLGRTDQTARTDEESTREREPATAAATAIGTGTATGSATETATQAMHWITIVIVSVWIAGIVIFSLPLGPSAFAAGPDLDLQQHLRRRPADVSPDRAAPGDRSRRRRPSQRRAQHQRRGLARRCVAAVDAGRVVDRGGGRSASNAGSVPSVDDLGPVDDARRCHLVPVADGHVRAFVNAWPRGLHTT
jgi:hypothetical protein